MVELQNHPVAHRPKDIPMAESGYTSFSSGYYSQEIPALVNLRREIGQDPAGGRDQSASREVSASPPSHIPLKYQPLGLMLLSSQEHRSKFWKKNWIQIILHVTTVFAHPRTERMGDCSAISMIAGIVSSSSRNRSPSTVTPILPCE